MTIKELISKLEKYDQDDEIVIHTAEFHSKKIVDVFMYEGRMTILPEHV